MEWLKSIARFGIPGFLWLRFGPRAPDAEPVRGLGEAGMSQLPRSCVKENKQPGIIGRHKPRRVNKCASMPCVGTCHISWGYLQPSPCISFWPARQDMFLIHLPKPAPERTSPPLNRRDQTECARENKTATPNPLSLEPPNKC